MDSTVSDEGLAILQLQKWSPSVFQLKLSDFREGFLSPMRDILLLLSYHCEAMLLPLSKAEASGSSHLESYRSGSPNVADTSTSDITQPVPSTSDSVDVDPCIDKSFQIINSQSNSYPYISDVISLAWGLCEDSSNPPEEALFKELLFVSGDHGVTVHAFCQSHESSEVLGPTKEVDTGQGSWVEWGPLLSLSQDLGAVENGLHNEVSGGSSNLNRINDGRKELNFPSGEVENDECSRNASPKRWLRTFLVELKTTKNNTNVHTRFPEKSSFPSKTLVVSFTIFESDSVLSDFLFSASSVSHEKEGCDSSITDSSSDTLNVNSSSNILEGGLSYKCYRVFSSNSYNLIGFALTPAKPEPVNSVDLGKGKCSNTLIAVARLLSWGIHWVWSVKLDGDQDASSGVEWTDFKFSDTFLICLKASGVILLYGAVSGEYVSHIDVLHFCGLRQNFNSNKHESSITKKDEYSIQDDKYDNSFNHAGGNAGEKRFKRLVTLPNSSVLGVIDEYGLTYVICTDTHIQGKHYSSEKFLSGYQQFGPGLLTVWEAGAAEIGCQRILSDRSGCQNKNLFPVRSRYTSVLNSQSKELHDFRGVLEEQKHQSDLFTSPLSVATQVMGQKKYFGSGLPSPFMRKIILPGYRSYKDDVVSLSPFGITRLNRQCNVHDRSKYQLVHSNYFVYFYGDDQKVNDVQGWEASVKEAVGCSFQGFLYLVTEDGLLVVLPSVSVSSDFFPVEAIGYRHTISKNLLRKHFEIDNWKPSWSPWKVEVLDRVLVYEGPEEADTLCLVNGWDLKISRIRRLQLALHYLKFEEIEKSLEMLVSVNLAEEGILRLLFAAVHLMLQKASNDNEASAALRLLALATAFATRMIRAYGISYQKKDEMESKEVIGVLDLCIPSKQVDKDNDNEENSKRLQEMAHFLEIIRNLQLRLNVKFKRPGEGVVEGAGTAALVNEDVLEYDSNHQVHSEDAIQVATPRNVLESPLPESGRDSSIAENLALMPVDILDSKPQLTLGNLDETSVLVSEGSGVLKRFFPVENPKDMIARWELDNLDLRNIVKDALLSGRLPLAVLKLHLHRFRDLVTDTDSHDTFTEVRDVGRAIAYDLFLKGETGLAITTLQKLGEDVESCLKQLFYGSVRKSLRMQIADEMKRFGYFGPHEWKIMEQISLIERLYPCSSFWSTLNSRQKEYSGASDGNAEREINLHILHKDLLIQCGEIDGVVLGSWMNSTGQGSPPEVDDDSTHSAYWTAAAIWSNAWDQQVVDRVVLDQPFLMGVNVLWESQLEYHMCHNDWLEVSKLLELVPSYTLSSGSLSVGSDDILSSSAVEQELSNYGIYSLEELNAVGMNVPSVRILAFSANYKCSMWLRGLMEQRLAKKFIFMKDYWESNAEIVHLLARSGFMVDVSNMPFPEESAGSSSDMLMSISDLTSHPEAFQALHKLVIRYCAQYNLPNLLDLYLDRQKLVVDHDSLSAVQDSVGDNQWAKWLLLQRVKGKEYDASFSNARAIASRNLVHGNNLSAMEIDDIIHSVDDIAEGAGEIAALATLMYAPSPIQDCLSSGSVNRYCGSPQCTLENLRPALQRFPTLWRALVAACFGQDPISYNLNPRSRVSGYSDLSDYLDWRENIFFSSGRDTSLLQMLPCWLPKAVRRLIQLYVQGPLGWQSLADFPTGESILPRDIDYLVNSSNHAEISAISWEAAIQKHIEEELYASSLEETGLGLEHHLHRGRPLAAFHHILAARVRKLESARRQANMQSDVHTLLAPTNQSEESLLSSVIPLAIAHFEETVLVSSCAFLLELCGFSASILRVDVAALRRISAFYKSSDSRSNNSLHSPKVSTFYSASVEVDIVESLARALAGDYVHYDYSGSSKRRGNQSNIPGKQATHTLMQVLQHLEKASLPLLADGMTCGSWLLNGIGDGAELRAQQKASSQNWNLVTVFCQMHNIPLSTKYLAVLAKDNDWIGFLSEAQVGGYPFETVLQVASKEFSDPRLQVHILTVLKSMEARRKASSDVSETRSNSYFSSENFCVPVELFNIIAECEKQENPGEALLLKAKNLCWSILAVIASCFPDVSPLSCLTVWLEITAARETSDIKVNDIASQMANNVGAAVEATNRLPASSRTNIFHYNRKNPKRRHLAQPVSVDTLAFTASDASAPGSTKIEEIFTDDNREKQTGEDEEVLNNCDEVDVTLSKMVAVLCQQQLFLPLLRAFEMFLPSCSLVPFIRALQAFSQMRLSEASAHLGSFSVRIKEEPTQIFTNIGREPQIGNSWITLTAVKAANAVLSTSPSPYEKRCFLQLLAATDFGDGGSAATHYRRLYWKINLAEPALRKDECLDLGDESLDDSSLLTALEKNRYWEQAHNWGKQLEASGGSLKSAPHHVTEMQAESMVAEWKEFLWDVPEERVALWGHCQTLFLRYSFPALQAGLFFLKHAEAAEKDLPPRELHELLLLSLQWLSGMITQSTPVCPSNLLREIETRVWLLAVESEAQIKNEKEFTLTNPIREAAAGKASNIVDRTASVITKMDNNIHSVRMRTTERNDNREYTQLNSRVPHVMDPSASATTVGTTKSKRRAKGILPSRRIAHDALEKSNDWEGSSVPLNLKDDSLLVDENFRIETSFSRWEERIGPAELERAVLSLLEFGQIAAARQLQQKLSPGHVPSEFMLVDAALKLAAISTPNKKTHVSLLDNELRPILQSYNLLTEDNVIEPLLMLESLATLLREGSGRGLCKRIISVVKAANVLGLSFSEAFNKLPLELLQLLSLKAQDSFDEANLLVQTHSMPAASIAQILAESFLKGLLAAHRGGYMDSQKDEGPAPLLWRFSDFLKWAELCSSEPEIGHALMRLVITGQEIPHACEVELLILSHHFYKSSACLDGVDVLVALAATRVEAYVSEDNFACLARLLTGVGNFHALNFILGILIENGQLDLLLQKYSAAADANTGTAEAVRGFCMAVLTSLKQFNPNDLDAFATVYNHFDMKHETASHLESRAELSSQQWFLRNDKDQNEDLLDSMRYFIEAAEVYSSIDAGNKTRRACAQASLVSLQIRMPDITWLNLSETNARRALVDQSRFQEALIVAEAYGLNQPSEWVLVLWNQMLKPELTEQFVAEFVAVLPLQPSMLSEIARFYRAEVAARGDQNQFSVWLTGGGGLPAEWAKYLARSFRCLLKMTRDLRLQLQLATVATGFSDIIDTCNKILDKVPENAGPLVLRKGHGGGYLPLM